MKQVENHIKEMKHQQQVVLEHVGRAIHANLCHIKACRAPVILARSEKVICKEPRVNKFCIIVITYFSRVSTQLIDAIYNQICCMLKENDIQYKVSLSRTCSWRYGFLKNWAISWSLCNALNWRGLGFTSDTLWDINIQVAWGVRNVDILINGRNPPPVSKYWHCAIRV